MNKNIHQRIAAKVKERKLAGEPSTTPAATRHPLKTRDPLAYYDSARKTFWSKNLRGEWLEVKEEMLTRLMRSQGMSKRQPDDGGMSDVDKALLAIQQEHDVHFAGQLAGYPVGLTEVCGNRVLITKGPQIPRAAAGDWPLFGSFVRSLLGDQRTHFFAWCKCALASLRAGPPFRPGQVLTIAGPPGCGKSLLQSCITDLLGGRSAKPYRYMIGGTQFNSDLFSAEHLMIEDEAASTDIRSRRAFGANVKNMIVNEVQSCHGKGRPALSLHPFWRISITLNAEPEDLMVLPPIDDGLRDKFIILQAKPAEFPFDGDDLAGRKQFREALRAELPAFVHWLKEWRIPKGMADRRYGVKSWHNAALVGDLDALAPENLLLQFIDSLEPWGDLLEEWEGTAVELQSRLCNLDRSRQVDKLLSYHSACGSYLGKLAREKRDRVQKVSDSGGVARWRIKKPA